MNLEETYPLPFQGMIFPGKARIRSSRVWIEFLFYT